MSKRAAASRPAKAPQPKPAPRDGNAKLTAAPKNSSLRGARAVRLPGLRERVLLALAAGALAAWLTLLAILAFWV
jgi:hypothetical protein